MIGRWRRWRARRRARAAEQLEAEAQARRIRVCVTFHLADGRAIPFVYRRALYPGAVRHVVWFSAWAVAREAAETKCAAGFWFDESTPGVHRPPVFIAPAFIHSATLRELDPAEWPRTPEEGP